MNSMHLNLILLIGICLFATCSATKGRSKISTKNCDRKCSTKYSDGDCWRPTFEFFTADVIDNVLHYLKVLEQAKNSEVSGDIIEYLRESRHNYYDEFLNDEIIPDEGYKNALKEIFDYFDDLEGTTKKTKLKSYFIFDESELPIKCPKSKCGETFNEEKKELKDIHMSKFIIFLLFPIAAAAVIAILIFHLLVESKYMILYKKST